MAYSQYQGSMSPIFYPKKDEVLAPYNIYKITKEVEVIYLPNIILNRGEWLVIFNIDDINVDANYIAPCLKTKKGESKILRTLVSGSGGDDLVVEEVDKVEIAGGSVSLIAKNEKNLWVFELLVTTDTLYSSQRVVRQIANEAKLSTVLNSNAIRSIRNSIQVPSFEWLKYDDLKDGYIVSNPDGVEVISYWELDVSDPGANFGFVYDEVMLDGAVIKVTDKDNSDRDEIVFYPPSSLKISLKGVDSRELQSNFFIHGLKAGKIYKIEYKKDFLRRESYTTSEILESDLPQPKTLKEIVLANQSAIESHTHVGRGEEFPAIASERLEFIINAPTFYPVGHYIFIDNCWEKI